MFLSDMLIEGREAPRGCAATFYTTANRKVRIAQCFPPLALLHVQSRESVLAPLFLGEKERIGTISD